MKCEITFLKEKKRLAKENKVSSIFRFKKKRIFVDKKTET